MSPKMAGRRMPRWLMAGVGVIPAVMAILAAAPAMAATFIVQNNCFDAELAPGEYGSSPTISGWTTGGNVSAVRWSEDFWDEDVSPYYYAENGSGRIWGSDVNYDGWNPGNPDTCVILTIGTGSGAMTSWVQTTGLLSLVAGQLYFLSFDIKPVWFADSDDTDWSLLPYENAHLLVEMYDPDDLEDPIRLKWDLSFNDPERPLEPPGWTEVYGNVSFTADEIRGPVQLRFTLIGGESYSGSYSGIALTNVVIGPVSNPVPEPGTWAMLAGLGLVGAAWYRRQRRQRKGVASRMVLPHR